MRFNRNDSIETIRCVDTVDTVGQRVFVQAWTKGRVLRTTAEGHLIVSRGAGMAVSLSPADVRPI